MRCFGDGNPLYEHYHDTEWGFPVRDERAVYERICLEAFQSGLAWITILRKREGFRAAFAGFDPDAVARFGDEDVARLMADATIVRNRAKIEAAIANARAVLALREEGVDLGELLWSFAPEPEPEPAKTEEPEQPGGVEGGVAGGVQGGTVGGQVGGVIGGTLGGTLGGQVGSTAPPQNVVLPFGAGMNRPSKVAGREPQYTREALAARIEGLAIVKCVIRTDGTLANCRTIKSLPHMDREILAALATHRYTPVMYQGRPVSVDYVFNIRLKLP